VTPVAVVAARRIAWVEGPDAEALLHGLLTADVQAIPVGGGAPSLILDALGHVVARMHVHRDAPDAFTLLLDPAPAPDGVAVITAHHVSEDAEVIGPETVEVLVITGDAAGDDVAVPGAIPGTTEVLADDPVALAASLGLTLSPADALEPLRIAAGIPAIGIDTGAKTLVQEAGLDDAVSYDKGCYLGQETVARLHYRGHANRRLCRIALDAPLPTGTDLTSGDVAAGTLTSAAEVPGEGWMALAMVRREVADGAEVSAGDRVVGRVIGAATSGATFGAS
jgi:folate-binding Fe-S cluster repair protein YgfZ